MPVAKALHLGTSDDVSLPSHGISPAAAEWQSPGKCIVIARRHVR
jgi:hypothetical protein